MGLMRTCKHVTALLMILSFPYAFVPRTLSISLLNPKAAPGTQTTRILPDTSDGGWADTSLGSERISRDTRQNNLMYGRNISGDTGARRAPSPDSEQTPRPSVSLPSRLTPTQSSSSLDAPLPPAPPQSISPQLTSQLSTSPQANPPQAISPMAIPSQATPPQPLSPQLDELQASESHTAPIHPSPSTQAPPPSTPSRGSGSEEEFNPNQSASHLEESQPGPSSQDYQGHESLPEDPELETVLDVVDPDRAYPFPPSSLVIRTEDFSYQELQQPGLLNRGGNSCYMISVVLLLHRLRIKDIILDNEFCSSSVTRNFKRSIITKVVRRALDALPSTQAFSITNIIACWHHIELQPSITIGVHEDAQEVLACLLNNLLLKIARPGAPQMLTKFQGRLMCRNTRDCINNEYQDFYVGQSDISPFMHAIGVDNSTMAPVRIRAKLSEFLQQPFESRCKAIMCKKRIRNAEIEVTPGRYTILALNRNEMNQQKSLRKIDLSAFHPDVDQITQEPVAVVSHAGSMASGHYISYSKINGEWFLNDDSKKLTRCQFSPFDQSHLSRETADIIVFENKL